MQTDRRFFAGDKNYILKEAQANSQRALLIQMTLYARQFYFDWHNPLGLLDDTTMALKNSDECRIQLFAELYDDLAAIYRYENADNQLPLLFDGTDHYLHFRDTWQQHFRATFKKLCFNSSFLKTIVHTAFWPDGPAMPHVVLNRLKQAVAKEVGYKVYVHKGVQRLSA